MLNLPFKNSILKSVTRSDNHPITRQTIQKVCRQELSFLSLCVLTLRFSEVCTHSPHKPNTHRAKVTNNFHMNEGVRPDTLRMFLGEK